MLISECITACLMECRACKFIEESYNMDIGTSF